MTDEALLDELLSQVGQYEDAFVNDIARHVHEWFEALLYALSRLGHAPSSASGQDSKLKVEPPRVFTGKGKELANFLFTLRAYLEVKGITSDMK